MVFDFERGGVIPVIKINDAKNAADTARALLAGGIGAMEITLRTDAGIDAIRSVCREVPDMCAGAGSVLSPESAQLAIAAGAKFIVSPGFDRDIAEVCQKLQVPYVPGCATATEIQAALRSGITFVKFFPAGAMGGTETLKALSAPFPEVRFMPTGGINEGNVFSYLSLKCVKAVGASCIAGEKIIDAGDFEQIRLNAERFLQAASGEHAEAFCAKRNLDKNAGTGVVSIGELMLRLSPSGKGRLTETEGFEAHFGGAEANVAVSLACMGVDSRYISKFPEGDLGDAALRTLNKYGVDTSGILRGGSRLGVYYLERGAGERPPKVIYDRAGSAIAAADPKEFDFKELFKGACWLHMTGITPALSENTLELTRAAMTTAQSMGMTVSFDLNYRKKLWDVKQAREVIQSLLPAVDVLISNEEHADKLCGIRCDEDLAGAASMLCEKFGFRAAAVTRRRTISAEHHSICAGALINGQKVNSPVHECEGIVDRAGGGDAFAAGFIYALMRGWAPGRAIRYASAASALKHTIEGDFSTAGVNEIVKFAGL